MSIDTESQGISDQLMQQNKIEEETVKQLLTLEKEFRGHNLLMKNELVLQKEYISRLWVLSQRYILLASTGPCCKFPEIYAAPSEETILQEFTEKLKTIKDSNCRISVSIKELRKSCQTFDKLVAQMDMKIESPLVIGDAFHKPIAFFIELISDLFKYFHAWLLKLRFTSHLIDPNKCEGIENYKSLIEPNEDFEEYLNVGLTYCKCLKSKPIC